MFLDKINNKYNKFLFSNNFDKIKKEIDGLHMENYDYVIMFGQKPIIKKATVELEAHFNDSTITTNYDVDALFKLFKENNITYRVSHRAGTSYCNFAYYNILKIINEKKLKTKVIFIHIPYLKNFMDMCKCVNLINNGGVLCQK